jgi:transposase
LVEHFHGAYRRLGRDRHRDDR